MQNKPYLVCHGVVYYGLTDEKLFFQWIKEIECIEGTGGSGEDLYLYLKSTHLTEDDLYEVINFFKRYKIDIRQLRPYLTDENKELFMMRKKAYWNKPLFGED